MSRDEPTTTNFADRPVSPFLPRLARLTLKELRETLRDRRTIVTLLLMPILLYPLLTLAFQRFVLSSATNLRVEYIIGLESEEAESILTTCLARGTVALDRKNQEAKQETTADQQIAKRTTPVIDYRRAPNLEHEVREYAIDVGIRLKRNSNPQFSTGQDVAVDIELVYLPGNKLGERALNSLKDQFLYRST
jgi:ABC-type Na+ efflux pump permease subunit